MNNRQMDIYIGIGTNLGNRVENIEAALIAISLLSGVTIGAVSEIIETEPFGVIHQPNFLNCIIKIESSLEPRDLLLKLQEIEDSMGRVRTEKWGARPMDLDILFYGASIIEEDDLIIPHPEIHKREFVLKSLQELCPDFIHPLLGKSVKELYHRITCE